VKCQVVLTADALRDLDDLQAFIASQDGVARADKILDGMRLTLSALGDFPRRGEYPPELANLGMREFRQVHYKPYRAIYRVQEPTVYVLVVADGRRDMQELLQRRLLG
jgi:toxin ParE1/3/4